MTLRIPPFRGARLSARAGLDLMLCSAWLLAGGVIVVLDVLGIDVPTPVRVLIGLPLTLAVPGYALTAALFGSSMPTLEIRAILTVILSVASVAVMAVVLDALGARLQATSLTAALVAVGAVAAAGALLRRRVPRAAARTTAQVRIPLAEIGLAAAVLAVVFALVGLAQGPVPAKVSTYSALWALPGSGATVRVGVVSAEDRSTRYRLEAVSGGRVIGRWRTILEPGERWTKRFRLSGAVRPGQQTRIVLFRGSAARPYREVQVRTEGTR